MANMMATYAFVDRCGNNFINHKGGVGLMITQEVTSTLSTISGFNSQVFISPTRSVKCNDERVVCARKKK